MARNKKSARRIRIKKGIRKRMTGTAQRPRLSIFRSNTNIYAQLIDDVKGVTIAGASSKIKEINGKKVTKIEKSKLVGMELAKRAKENGIAAVVFDRNGFKYHGRVKALAEGAREGGLKI